MTWISESITASFGHVISGHWLPSVRKTICLARFGKMAKTLGGNFQFGHLRNLNVKQFSIQAGLCWNPLQPWTLDQLMRKCPESQKYLGQEALNRFNAESTRCAKQTTKGVDDGPVKTLVILNSNHPCLQLQVMIIHGVITCYHQTHVSF